MCLHVQKLRNVTGVISETTEKIISMMQKNAGEFMVKVVFSVVSDSCFISNDFMKSPNDNVGSFAK